jgi:Do/DeqQ family serine protease
MKRTFFNENTQNFESDYSANPLHSRKFTTLFAKTKSSEMNTKNLLFTFSIAILGALVGALAFSKFSGYETRIVEVPIATDTAAQFTTLQALPQGGFPDLTFAAEKSINAVVHVNIKGTSSAGQFNSGNPLFDFFFGPKGFQMEPQPIMGSGSGVILTKDGFIVTNNHVVNQADEIEVVLNDKRSFKAVKVGADATTDIALLKIEASELPFLSYGNSDAIKVGEWVLAVGNPFNLNSTVTAGIVSAKSRNLQILGNQMGIESFIQTDAAVNPGNSGGALVNTQGDLVGINTAIASRTGSYSGYSFAVPVSIVQKVVADLMEFGEVQRGLLGISIRDIDNNLSQELKIDKVKGVYVAQVVEGGGAEKAGIKNGDIILKINGDEVNTVSVLQERVSRHRPGDKLDILVLRDGKIKPFNVTLRNMQGGTDMVQTSSKMAAMGAIFEPISDNDKQSLGLRNGLKIKSLSAGKLKSAGIQEGYIIVKANRVPINTEEDFKKVVEMVDEGLFLTGIYPNGQVAYFAINIQD